MRVRGALIVALAALAVVSIDTPRARSQANGSNEPAGSGSASGDPTAPGDDEDDGSAGSGSAGPIVAPKDPGQRKAWLTTKLAAAITSRPTLARARIGYAVTDLVSGQELAAREPDVKLNLASNAKVMTAAAALSGLGAGFKWRTTVYTMEPPDEAGLVKGDLYVRGRGDPTLSIGGLRQLAHDIAARGVREIEGKLILDTTYFDNVVEPPHFDEQPKERAAFRAPVAAFGVNRSSVTVTVMANPDGTARVSLDPVTDYTKITKDEVTSVTRGRTRLKLEMKPKRDHVEIEITGQIKTGEGSWDLRRRVDDPARFAAVVFKRELAAQGVRLRKDAIGYAQVPLTAKIVAYHDSPPLSDVLRAMNKYSDNYYAECVLKTLGAETKGTPGPATWADGLAAVVRELAKLGLAAGSYRIGNGSGLYSATEVSPRQLVTLFARSHADYRIGAELLQSLPTGGYDGTLARRYRGTQALGRVHAKTGTLDKVNTLAGYVAVHGNHVLAFAILVNEIPQNQRRAVRAMADEMVEIMVAYLAPS